MLDAAIQDVIASLRCEENIERAQKMYAEPGFLSADAHLARTYSYVVALLNMEKRDEKEYAKRGNLR
jgi:hypothetical protein